MASLGAVLITGCFLIVVGLILLDKLNRAIVSVSGALFTYYVLTFLEGRDFQVIVDILFGSSPDGFVNLRSLILIVGIMFIVKIAEEAGLFQFVAVYAIKLSRGNPVALMTIFCSLAVISSAILNNIVTVMILIPLTITISRILDCNPSPYILTQAVMVNIGGTIFSISSIPNILITTSAQISFIDFFVNVGLWSIVVVAFTIPFFLFLYKPDLVRPDDHLVETLNVLDVWNVVPSKRLLIISMLSLLTLMTSFLVIPASLVPPDAIALTIGMAVVVASKLDNVEEERIIKKLDYELILYLLGIFVIAGGLELTGVIGEIGKALKATGGGIPILAQIVALMWVAAFLSSIIDNIPITKVMIPLVGDFIPDEGISQQTRNSYYYALSFGSNWGDNLTPLGDNILVMNLAKEGKRPIKMFDFWRLGFATTIFQLILGSFYFVFVFDFIIGLFILLGAIIAVLGLWISSKKVTFIGSIGQKFRRLLTA